MGTGCYSRSNDPELPDPPIDLPDLMFDDEEELIEEIQLPDEYESYTDLEKFKFASKTDDIGLL